MTCYFCKKRVWFWQDELWTYHLDCYRLYVLQLMKDAKGTHRQALLAELRLIRDTLPHLRLNVPLD